MARYKNLMLVMMMAVAFFVSASVPIYAVSYKEVTMSVGETKTLYLPSSVTSKDLKSVTFYSNGISYVQVTSYTEFSVTVKAIKAFSSPVIVRCDYRYFVRSGSFTYEAAGAYDYRITVVGNGGGGGSGIEPTSIRFSSSAVGISVGESRQLSPTVLPSNAEYTLTWSINDESVATVSDDGLLVGKSAGAADLKVMADNGVYAMLRVVVSQPVPSSVSVLPSSVTLTEGQSTYLTATVYPSGASQSVSWSSSNTSVASVSSFGRVTALKAGSATITATASNGVKGRCVVTCKETIPSVVLSDKDGVGELPAKANVTYERVLYSGWNSVCVPFAITQSMLNDFCEGCRIVKVMEMEVVGRERFVSVEEVMSAGAGEPCLVYAPQDVICKFSLNQVELSAEPKNTEKLKGVYKRTIIGAGHYKLTSDGGSLGVTQDESAIVAPFRAYMISDEDMQTRSSVESALIVLNRVNY